MGWFKKTPQEEAKELRKLRARRIKAEGRAKLRKYKETELEKIKKAEGTRKPSFVENFIRSMGKPSKRKAAPRSRVRTKRGMPLAAAMASTAIKSERSSIVSAPTYRPAVTTPKFEATVKAPSYKELRKRGGY